MAAVQNSARLQDGAPSRGELVQGHMAHVIDGQSADQVDQLARMAHAAWGFSLGSSCMAVQPLLGILVGSNHSLLLLKKASQHD